MRDLAAMKQELGWLFGIASRPFLAPSQSDGRCVGEVNMETSLAAADYHPACDIGHRDRSEIQCINEKQGYFAAHSQGTAFLRQYFHTFVEVCIDAFDNHQIMVFSTDGVDIKVH